MGKCAPRKKWKLKAGDEAPPFSLPDQEGRTLSLEDFRGGKLLLYFYPRAMTSGCTRQSVSVSEALPELERLGVRAVGISPDAPERQKRFDDRHGLGFPLLSDPDGAVARAYGAWGTRTVSGRKKEGIVRSAFLVDEEGRLQAAWYRVKPEATVPSVLECLSG